MYSNEAAGAGWWQGYANYANFIQYKDYNACYPLGSDTMIAYVVPEFANATLGGRIIGKTAKAINTQIVLRHVDGTADTVIKTVAVSNAAEETFAQQTYSVKPGDVFFFIAKTATDVVAWDGVIFDFQIDLDLVNGTSEEVWNALNMVHMPMTGAHNITVTGGVVDHQGILTETMKLDQTSNIVKYVFKDNANGFAWFGYDTTANDYTWGGATGYGSTSVGMQVNRVFYSNNPIGGNAGMVYYAQANGFVSMLGKAVVHANANLEVYILNSDGSVKNQVAKLGQGLQTFADHSALNCIEINQGEALAVVFVAGPWESSSAAMAFDFYAAPVVKKSTVVDVPVTNVTVTENAKTLLVGENYNIVATVSPENATNKTVTYASSDESIATVDENGKVTAVKAGKATITVTSVADETKTATVEITVENPVIPVTSVTVTETTKTILVGENYNIVATVSPEDATNKTVTYASNNESVATVDENGKVTAVKAGKATITVTSVADETKTATVEITVETPVVNVTGVTVTESEIEMELGKTYNIVATVSPENATNKTVTYASSDESIATVDENGKVTAVKADKVTITVTSVADETKTATVEITIYEVEQQPTVENNKKGCGMNVLAISSVLTVVAGAVVVLKKKN